MGNLSHDLRRYRVNGKIAWYEPSLPVIVMYRLGQAINKFPKILRLVVNIIFIPIYTFLTLFTGIHLPRGAKIGPGLRIYHFGCIILNPKSIIGENCTLRHEVTIGNKSEEDEDVPIIGNNVEIGAGAKILGNIHIGNNVKIGANAVVLCDVPDNCIAVGIPAKVIPLKNKSL